MRQIDYEIMMLLGVVDIPLIRYSHTLEESGERETLTEKERKRERVRRRQRARLYVFQCPLTMTIGTYVC